MTSGLFTRVTFKVSVETQFGDSVYVTGNAPILGALLCLAAPPVPTAPSVAGRNSALVGFVCGACRAAGKMLGSPLPLRLPCSHPFACKVFWRQAMPLVALSVPLPCLGQCLPHQQRPKI
jgi:hypothetical protein